MKDTAAYGSIAKEYQESKQLPFRIHIERHMIFNLLGNLQGRSVLDLACGEGIYSRKIKMMGAKSVTGVDISSAMIELAEIEEKREPLGIDYVVSDASHFRTTQPADIILGSYFLNYAKSWEQILVFCQSLYDNLNETGTFVGFNDNPANLPVDYPRYRKFGFYKTTPENRQEGDPITYHILNSNGVEFKFDNYYLSKETYERAFHAVGFKDFRWHSPELSPDSAADSEPGYWDEFLEFPPIIAMSARK